MQHNPSKAAQSLTFVFLEKGKSQSSEECKGVHRNPASLSSLFECAGLICMKGAVPPMDSLTKKKNEHVKVSSVSDSCCLSYYHCCWHVRCTDCEQNRSALLYLV